MVTQANLQFSAWRWRLIFQIFFNILIIMPGIDESSRAMQALPKQAVVETLLCYSENNSPSDLHLMQSHLAMTK